MAKGYPDGTFKPDNTINRSEFFSLVNNAFDFTVASEDTYTDVAADKWYAPVIAKAKAAGYIVGYPDGGIHPEMNISRQEVATVISRLESMTPKTSTLDYTDASDVADWSEPAVIALYEAEIMIGYPDGSFMPEKQITRAEAIVVLTNVLNHQLVNQTTDIADVETLPVDTDTTEEETLPVDTDTTEEETLPVDTDTTEEETLPVDTDTTEEETLPIVERIMNLTLDENKATVKYANPTNEDINWTSSDTDVATVTDGVVRPVGLGNAIITGSTVADETVVITIDVTVLEADNAAVVPVVVPPVIPVVVPKGTPVDLGTAGDYVILSKSGIDTVPTSVITGNIGVSPIKATAITGFSLTVDSSNEFATSDQVTGQVFASDYTSPTSSNLTTAVSNMETAYTDAAGRAADYTELYTGNLSGKTLTAGVYKWGTGVLIDTDLTLSGGPDDVFIFQIGKGVTQAAGAKIILKDGIQAKNIFWQVAKSVEIGTGSHFEGNILCMTNIALNTGASINGRLLAQTAVTLKAATVVKP
jgi:hypothetical protein